MLPAHRYEQNEIARKLLCLYRQLTNSSMHFQELESILGTKFL